MSVVCAEAPATENTFPTETDSSHTSEEAITSSETSSESSLPFEKTDNINQCKTTLEKRGTAPPEITLNELVQKLSSYASQNPDLDQAKNTIKNKYKIHDDLWSIDNINRAWEETQTMDGNGKEAWTTMIMFQVIKTYERELFQITNKCDTESKSQQSTSTKTNTKCQTKGDSLEKNDNMEDLVNDPDNKSEKSSESSLSSETTVNINQTDNDERTTLEKGGTAPPEITLKELVQNVSSYASQDSDLIQQNTIEKNYGIQKNYLCLINDIKQAWEETQSFTIMLQIIQRMEMEWSSMSESQSNLEEEKIPTVPPDMTELVEKLSLYVSQNSDLNKTKQAIEKKYWIEKEENDMWSIDDIKRAWGKTQRMDGNAKREWTFVIISQLTMKYCKPIENFEDWMQLRGKKVGKKLWPEKPKKKRQTQKNRRSTRKETLEKTQVSEDSQVSGNTIYIRIPLSIINAESNADEQQASRMEVKNNTTVEYKLIDGVPSFAKTMRKTSYVVQYDNRTRNPAWVFEILNKETLTQNCREKKITFKNDDMIHEYYRTSEGTLEGYDRGHMAAARNHPWSEEDTFLLSNVAPQYGPLNKGHWKCLENYCRGLTEVDGCSNVYVYTGPLYCPTDLNIPVSQVQYNIVGNKAVPTHFFKVIIVDKKDGKRRLDCFVAPNENPPGNTEIQVYREVLENIEKASGLLFREESPDPSYKEKTVEVKFSDKEENGHDAKTQVRIYTKTNMFMEILQRIERFLP